MTAFLTPNELETIRLSLRVAGWAVLCSLPVGIGTAWVLTRCHFPGKTMANALIHLPLVLPPVVIGYLLLIAMGNNGWIGSWIYKTLGITMAFNWKGAALAAATMAFPLMVRALKLALENVDPDIEIAARTLGAGPVRVFITITLPLIIPGMITGSILAFARSLGEFGATITFVSNIEGQTRTLPLALHTLTQVPGGEQGAFRLCVIAILVAVGAILISDYLSRYFYASLRGEA